MEMMMEKKPLNTTNIIMLWIFMFSHEIRVKTKACGTKEIQIQI